MSFSRAVDLHVHSNRSDGSFPPARLVDYAREKGLAAFALTDHDTTDGLDEAIGYAESLEAEDVPEVVPGIEFSTEYLGRDVHILGLYINYRDPYFQGQLKAFVESRDSRNRRMCALLQEAHIPVTYEDLTREYPGAVITRAHYAKYMCGQGYVSNMSEAFERYIGDHCPCYVPREKVTPAQAVQLVLAAGGIPVLAHPVLYRMEDRQLDKLAAELKDAGLIGLEAVYSTYTADEERRMRTLAKRYGFLVSGGSDFHGANKPGLDLAVGYGRLFVPYSVLEDIRRAIPSGKP